MRIVGSPIMKQGYFKRHEVFCLGKFLRYSTNNYLAKIHSYNADIMNSFINVAENITEPCLIAIVKSVNYYTFV